ncbi:hypothetical protein PCIT_a2649 [Pseudoalteromonas citrea]|uniref:Uncharacterized protein n=2 Tax=Pseudoalteromonas citrea TaxID=43655 RepID=A0AAD4AHC7_9GAMM|nr:hypothetical protein [Pseudoalteromonas citrea]KAF7769753.1 hypothetical protein PCIT_a2649 [Pseudoalteromonas citrea]
MDKQQRQEILTLSWSMHDKVEQAVLQHPAATNDPSFSEKQRLLLADMALHLLQTALKPGQLDDEKLRNNLNGILSLSDDFLEYVDLGKVADGLFSNQIEGGITKAK